jgi:hypothetical protein
VLPMDPPAIDHRTLYRQAIAQTQRNADRLVLEALEDRVVQAGESYSHVLQADGAYAVVPLALSAKEEELARKLYDSRLVSKTGACRTTYTDIRGSTAFCPYCEYGEVYEVDHFLPKDSFPELNILPANLVPICHACNHIKLVGRPENATDSLLHPYFDRLPRDVRWLFAVLSMSANGPVLAYHVNLNAAHGAVAGRLTYHFRELQLGRRYRERSSKVLVEIESDLEGLFATLGPEGLMAHFTSVAEKKFEDHGNVLEAAAYAAAAENDAYCQGQYRS